VIRVMRQQGESTPGLVYAASQFAPCVLEVPASIALFFVVANQAEDLAVRHYSANHSSKAIRCSAISILEADLLEVLRPLPQLLTPGLPANLRVAICDCNSTSYTLASRPQAELVPIALAPAEERGTLSTGVSLLILGMGDGSRILGDAFAQACGFAPSCLGFPEMRAVHGLITQS